MKTLAEQGPLIVLLNGPKLSGKTTAAKVLCSMYRDSYRAAFAQPLKEGVHVSLDIDRPWNYWDERKDKDEPNEEFFGSSPRQAYINHSEFYMKKFYGEDIFARLMICKIRNLLRTTFAHIIFIADCGFQIEYEHLSRAFSRVYVIRLMRPDHTFDGDSREYIENVEPQHYQILHNQDTLPNFEAEIRVRLQRIIITDARLNVT